MGNVIIVGSSNTDMVLYTPAIPRPGETVMGNNFTVNHGGKGANQAVAAAKALAKDGDVYFVAAVGDDDFGKQSLTSYNFSGVKTEYIATCASASSGVALIFVADSAENTIGINSGANALLSPEMVETALSEIPQAEVIMTQLESPLETVGKSMRLGKEKGITTILNPAPACDLPEEIFADIDIITPNQTETEFYTGVYPENEASYLLAADWFHQRGVETVIITLGSKGVFYSDQQRGGEKSSIIPALKVQAVDTVGAGDTFNGAFASALARGTAKAEAISFACAAAAISVSRLGAQKSTPSYQEILELL